MRLAGLCGPCANLTDDNCDQTALAGFTSEPRRGAGPRVDAPIDPACFRCCRREIIEGVGEAQQPLRAMRTKARDGFIKTLRDAHRWLDELLYDPTRTVESLAVREGKSERSIRMTLSLAFISSVLAEAAIGGRLPRGFCVKRLTDLPMLWSEQWRALGLQAPIQAAGRTQLIDATAIHSQSFLRNQFGEREASAPASPSRGPGNGILRAETGGRFQAQNAGERSEFGSQTTTRRAIGPKLRGFLCTRKPRRFAATGAEGIRTDGHRSLAARR